MAKWTKEACLEALIAAYETIGEYPFSGHLYERRYRQRNAELPSYSAITKRLGDGSGGWDPVMREFGSHFLSAGKTLNLKKDPLLSDFPKVDERTAFKLFTHFLRDN